MNSRNKPIGFFDSGVGGISVLKEALKIMPNEDYIYYGDSINAPYGVKKLEEVRELTYKAVEFLIDKGAKAIVIACNTATSAAVASLRKTYPDMPLVGIEPALKPAVEMHKDGPVIIMATPMTLKEQKFQNLLNKYKDNAEIIPMACAGLMEFVEQGNLDSDELKNFLREKFKGYDLNKIGSIVLGCTHYPFVRNAIIEIVGNNIPVIDGGAGTCRELRRRLQVADLITDSDQKGKVTIYNSLKNDNIIDISNKLLNL